MSLFLVTSRLASSYFGKTIASPNISFQIVKAVGSLSAMTIFIELSNTISHSFPAHYVNQAVYV